MEGAIVNTQFQRSDNHMYAYMGLHVLINSGLN